VEALVTLTAEGDEVLDPFFTVVRVRAMVHVKRSIATATQAASVPISTVDLLLEHRPLSRLPAL
jgi:hypothetical protein